ncbi:hypothetical protein [Paenibacillus sp. J2TS4]|nr:hypothetical protein [Paenibacillus sp. J2TS4]GIP32446.1 hypothetical protein J2TS4_16560 [Paenibacillus sp. J2TS4]
MQGGETKTVEFITFDPVENYASLKIQVDSAFIKEEDDYDF